MSDDIRGFSLPFRIDPASGGVAQVAGADKIKENIIHILLTGVGERLMRRSFGGGVHQLVHDPINTALLAVIQHQIARSIGEWEPRVLLQEVIATAQGGVLLVHLTYVIRATRQPERLTVPLELGGV